MINNSTILSAVLIFVSTGFSGTHASTFVQYWQFTKVVVSKVLL